MASKIPLERDCVALHFVVIAAYAKFAPFGYCVSGMTQNSRALNLVPPWRDYLSIAILTFYEIVIIKPYRISEASCLLDTNDSEKLSYSI